ncbi:MAG: tetraacyldisaccharide 4'-kinase [Proteobacteria bacterium]|nr:tetraacyldisaccharide 4'-kinase [Pseudomonadota bacterium]
MMRIILSSIFKIATRIRAYLYSTGLIRSYKINAKIISIGNVSIGGAGKTPLTLLLNERLRHRGFNTAIIEKGYKSGLSRNKIILVQKGHDIPDGNIIGDEPLMVWKQLPTRTRLAIAHNKTQAAFEIKKKWPDTDIIIVDDGFQHLRLKRDLDIVLIDASLGMKDKVIPSGRLREPYSSLKRANVVLFTKSDGITNDDRNNLKNSVLCINPILKVFFSTINFVTSSPITGKKVFPVSAIYNPIHLHKKIKEGGAIFERYMAFSDHYSFNRKVLNIILREADRSDAEYIVVTSKDWVKMKPFVDNEKRFIETWYDHKIENEEEFINCCTQFLK